MALASRLPKERAGRAAPCKPVKVSDHLEQELCSDMWRRKKF